MEDQERTYQTFKLEDFARQPEWLLAQIDYLQQMFELEVENQRDKPIVICLRGLTYLRRTFMIQQHVPL